MKTQKICGLAVGTALFFSCQGTAEREGTEFRTLHVTETIAMDNSTKAPACTISLQIDSLNDTTSTARNINMTIAEQAFGNRMSSIAQAADSFCKANAGHYKKDFGELYKADVTHGIRPDWYNHSYKIQTEQTQGRASLICYRITARRYEGGARETEEIRYVNFDRKTGKVATLDDLFKPTYKAMLPSLLQSAIQERFGCKDMEELHAHGILRLTPVYVPENYRMGPEVITFLYNAGEIASYDTGSIAVDIPYDQLKTLLKTE